MRTIGSNEAVKFSSADLRRLSSSPSRVVRVSEVLVTDGKLATWHFTWDRRFCRFDFEVGNAALAVDEAVAPCCRWQCDVVSPWGLFCVRRVLVVSGPTVSEFLRRQAFCSLKSHDMFVVRAAVFCYLRRRPRLWALACLLLFVVAWRPQCTRVILLPSQAEAMHLVSGPLLSRAGATKDQGR